LVALAEGQKTASLACRKSLQSNGGSRIRIQTDRWNKKTIRRGMVELISSTGAHPLRKISQTTALVKSIHIPLPPLAWPRSGSTVS